MFSKFLGKKSEEACEVYPLRRTMYKQKLDRAVRQEETEFKEKKRYS